jgi:hypothetical protein
MPDVDMTGWMTGQVFLQTVDEQEVRDASAFLSARGIAFQVLTLSERMVLNPTEPGDPAGAVATDRFSIAVQLGGFPQVVGPVLNDLIQRAHGAGWTEPPAGSPPQGPGT